MVEFARKRPNKLTHISYEEIIDGGYLVLKNKKGEDCYRIPLLQDDRRKRRPTSGLPKNAGRWDGGRVLQNCRQLRPFRARLGNTDDPNVPYN